VVGVSAADAGAQEHHHGPGPHAALAQSASRCIQSGEECVQHCLEQLAKGATEMAGCARSVHEMLAGCGAIQQLANLESKHLARLAKGVAEICRACESECRKHEAMHAVCKACAEACAACAAECDKAAA
jgi:Cys-rich four helix bundle protein (predicted Tat secretion target)